MVIKNLIDRTIGNTQKELIDILNINILKIIPESTNAKEIDNTESFIKAIKHELEISINNTMFDVYYDGNNYDELINNKSKYIDLKVIKLGINNSTKSIKNICKTFNKPCKLELDNNKIYMNNNILVFQY